MFAKELKVHFSGGMAGRFEIYAQKHIPLNLVKISLRCSNLEKTEFQTLTSSTLPVTDTLIQSYAVHETDNFLCGVETTTVLETAGIF